MTNRRQAKRLTLEVLEPRRLMIVGQRVLPQPTGRGTGFDGVVGIDLSGFSTPVFNSTNCTGALLETRRHILTAAHCVDDDGDRRADSSLTVTLDVAGAPAGRFILMEVPSRNITIHPNWNGSFDVARGGDLAILELPALAPFPADGYAIYRGGDEVGQVYTMVGYGRTGVGARGQSESNSGPSGSVRRTGKNVYDATAEILRGAPLRETTPPAGTALASDFDNGSTLADAFGRLYRIPNTGLPEGDSLEAQGDSGGPSFLGEPGSFQIVGIVSYGIDRAFNPSLVTDTNDAYVSFGEINVNTRVSAYTSWIDFVTRRSYDLTLDMRYQLEGLFQPAADTIELSVADGALRLRVAGEVVFEETTLTRIASISLLGSQDNETFRILVDDPGILEIITVDGRGGTNHVVYTEDGETHPHTNPIDPLDVNADGLLTALDVLLIINQLNSGGSTLPGAGGAPPYLDVNADDRLTALDALLVINALNSAPEGMMANLSGASFVFATGADPTGLRSARAKYTADSVPGSHGLLLGEARIDPSGYGRVVGLRSERPALAGDVAGENSRPPSGPAARKPLAAGLPHAVTSDPRNEPQGPAWRTARRGGREFSGCAPHGQTDGVRWRDLVDQAVTEWEDSPVA